MYRISGFADEISPNLEEQIAVLLELNMEWFELRSVGGKNVLDLTESEATEIRARTRQVGIRVSAIGSPIGKVPINADFSEHFRRFERALELADFFEARGGIRIFSYYPPEGESDVTKYRDEVLRRMEAKAKRAEKAGIKLLLENDSGLYGDTVEGCLDILTTIGSPYLRATFDPANYLHTGQIPYPDCFQKIKDYIEYIHVKDMDIKSKQVVPAGEGDANFEGLVEAQYKRGYKGYWSLEPHLAQAGRFSGFSGADKFKLAYKALKSILDKYYKQ